MKIARITKSEAARALGISRRTVIRYALAGRISQDRRGKVLLSEVRKTWESPIRAGWPNTRGRRGVRSFRRPRAYWPLVANGVVTNGRAVYLSGQHRAQLEALLLRSKRENGVTSKTKLVQFVNKQATSFGYEQFVLALQKPSAALQLAGEVRNYLLARGLLQGR